MTSIGVCITVIIIVIIVMCYLILISRAPGPVLPVKINNIRLDDGLMIRWDAVKGATEYTMTIKQGDKISTVTTKDNSYKVDEKSVCVNTDYTVKYLMLTSNVLTVKAVAVGIPSNVKST